ncbi:MAG: 4Fe-4S dicluster domain-containing protein [Thermoanaerobacterales bacterium]|nr:4Fe-4S dicluster domain-containing protein [Bacillota bacterium]MDI6907787.1 4Fe-4S dicluster domain-containing protein [Thermoanaerobacterales bacterium]
MDRPVNLSQRAADGAAFARIIAAESEQDVRRCYQCGKCTAGCPVAFAGDVMPHQVMRFLQLGMKEDALGNRMIWLCSTCSTCTTRCPCGIDLARVMDCLRIAAREEGRTAAGREVALFNRTFLDSVRRFGRAHEASLAALLNLKGGRPLKDIDLGIKFLARGKLKLAPTRAGRGAVARLFAASRREEAGG